MDRVYPAELVGDAGVVHAAVEKTLYVRRAEAALAAEPPGR